MSCERYREQFTDYLENALAPESWRELESHLAACPDCAAQIKAFRRTVSALRAVEPVEMPRHLRRRIRERLESESLLPLPAASGSVAPDPAARIRARFNWSAAGALAAACLVLAVVVAYGLRGSLYSAAPWSPEMATPAPGLPPSPGAMGAPPAAAEPTAESAVEAPTHPAPGSEAPAAADRAGPPPVQEGTPGTRPPGPPAPAGPPPAAPSPAAATPPTPATELVPKSTPPGATERAMIEPAGTAAPRISFGPAAEDATSAPLRLDVSVDPPAQRVVGEWGTLRVALKADRDVPMVTVRLVAEGALEVRGSPRLYEGPLAASQLQRLSAQVRATAPGDHRLRVVLDSPTPGVATTVPVLLNGYRSAEVAGLTYRQFRSVSLAQAAAAVARDCGLTVEVSPLLAQHRLSADLSQGVSGPRALALLARLAGGRVEQTARGYEILPAE